MMTTRAAIAATAAAACAAACSGTSGTLSVSLTTAPGSTIMTGVDSLRVTITDPLTVTTVPKGSDGTFDLGLTLPGDGTSAAIIVEGLAGSDGSGATIAVGESPTFPFAAIDAELVIYMAAPMSFGASPVALGAPRSGVGVAALTYGGVIAGGRDAAGSATDELAIYNAFDHTLAQGSAMPDVRSDQTVATGTSGLVYLFGGLDGSGSAAGTLWRFDPTQAPSGDYDDLGSHQDFARADQLALLDGDETFVVTGAPALDLDGTAATLTARTDLADAPATGASVLAADDVETAILCGSAGVTRLRNGTLGTLAIAGAARTDAAVFATAAGQIAVAGGELAGTPTTDVITIDAETGSATTVAGALSTPRANPAAAGTPRYFVIAGGSDATGAVSQTADILDAKTLALVATVPVVVGRVGATALALPNEQVLIVGGADGSGAPSDVIELFTPDAPPEGSAP